MINWFNIPDEGLSNGGLFEVKELEVTENGTYETKGEMYNKVTVNVEGGGGESDFSTAKMTVINNRTTTPVGDIQCNDCPIVLVEDGELTGGFYVEANNQSVCDVVLYKGHAHIYDIKTGIGFLEDVDFKTEVSVSGNAVLNSDDYVIDITGDCTITIDRVS